TKGDKALLRFDGPDPGDRVKDLLAWRGGRNAYVNFGDVLIDGRTGGDEPTPMTMGKENWKRFAADDPKFVSGRRSILDWPRADGLARALPAHFKLKADTGMAEYGAPADQLPSPGPETPRVEAREKS